MFFRIGKTALVSLYKVDANAVLLVMDLHLFVKSSSPKIFSRLVYNDTVEEQKRQ